MKNAWLRGKQMVGLFFVFLALTLLYVSAWAQPAVGHITYGLISHVIYDTSKVKPEDIPEILEVIGNDMKADVYYNTDWLIVLRQDGVKHERVMYDRKNAILYSYTDAPDKKTVNVDSLRVLKDKDDGTVTALATIRTAMGLVDKVDENQVLAGWDAYKMSFTGLHGSTTPDEIWKSGFSDVPNFIYPENFYHLNYGLPIRITQDIDGVRFTWGVIAVEGIKKQDAVFDKPNEAYTLCIYDSKAMVLELAGFLEED